MWSLYLWRIDVFEQEPLSMTLAALLLGAGAAIASPVPTDALALAVPPTGTKAVDDLLLCFLRIGLVEETMKLAPVVLIAALSRQVSEPVDLLIYGSLAALGFATVENALYFSDLGLGIAYARFQYSTLVHLACTATACYVWMRARFMRRARELAGVTLGLLAAAGLHGLYDYAIIAPSPEMARIVGALFIVLAVVYSIMLGNALNFSPAFSVPRSLSRRLSNYELVLSFALLVLVVTFLSNNFTYASDVALTRLWVNGRMFLIYVVVMLAALGELRLVKGRLAGVTPWRWGRGA